MGKKKEGEKRTKKSRINISPQKIKKIIKIRKG